MPEPQTQKPTKQNLPVLCRLFVNHGEPIKEKSNDDNTADVVMPTVATRPPQNSKGNVNSMAGFDVSSILS